MTGNSETQAGPTSLHFRDDLFSLPFKMSTRNFQNVSFTYRYWRTKALAVCDRAHLRDS